MTGRASEPVRTPPFACAGCILRLRAALCTLIALTILITIDACAAQERTALRVICDRSTVPFAYLDENNHPAGITIDLWQLWSRKTGIPVEFIPVQRGEELQNLRGGVANAAIAIFTPEDSPPGILLSRPILEFPFGLFFPAALGAVKSPTDIPGGVVGVVRGYAGEEQMRQRFPQLHLKLYAGADDMVKDVLAGKTPAFVAPEPVGRYHLARRPGGAAFRFSAMPVSVRWLRAAVPAGNQALLEQIDAGFRDISEDEIHALVDLRVIGRIPSQQANLALHTAILFGGLFLLAAVLVALRLRALSRSQRAATVRLQSHAQELELSHRTLQRNEEWLRTTLDSIGDAVIATDAQGKVVRLNPVAETLTGWLTEEAVGHPLPEVFRIINADTRQTVESPAQKVLELGQIVGLANHTVLISRTGAEYQIADSGAPIRHPDGSIGGVVLVFRDVTQEYATQKEIADREQQFRLAIDGTGAGVWDWNIQTGEIQINERWATMLGYVPQELLPVTTQTRAALCNSEDLKKSLELLQRHFDNETQHYECELRLRHKNGSWVWVLDRGTVSERAPDGSPLRMVGTHSDITARKQAQDMATRRLVALTRPLDCVEDLQFTDLFPLEDIQRLQDLFANATGVASVITTPDGQPITRASNFCRLCRDIIRKTPAGLANCMRSDATLGDRNPEGPTVCPCLSGGLWDAGASIVVGERHIANWLIGQVRDQTQTEDKMRAYARQIGADENELIVAFREVPSMPEAQFRRIAQMLFDLARILSDMAYQNVQQARFISERRKAEEQLRQSEENLRATLNSIGDAVIATDTAGLVTRLNPVAEHLTGWQQEQAAGKPLDHVFQIINAETRLPADNPVWKVLETGRIVGLANHTVLIARGGEERQIADSGAPIRDADGNITGVVLVFRDVTQEYALQEQLLQSRKMDAIGQLAGGVAHDFNNMLGGILGSAELLQRRCTGDAQAMEYAELIITAARRAGDLTNKLLSFARKGKALSTPIDAHTPLREAAALLARTTDKQIAVRTDLQAARSIVTGDDSQLQNAFLNLGLNAAQAMPAGGTISFITTNVMLEPADCEASAFDLEPGDYLQIQVTDTGCGIREEYLERIFEPFFTTKEPGKGTGLGLAAVYGTLQQHRGDIAVSSKVGEGTCFTLRLPLSEAGQDPRSHTDSDRLITGKGRILVVDDEAIIRATASAILSELGYDVLIAESGDMALELYTQNPEAIDLIILDLMMPGMSGRECFRQLRERSPGCRIILSSGFSHSGDLDDLRKAGFSGFLAKPFRSSDLSRAVANALNHDQPA